MRCFRELSGGVYAKQSSDDVQTVPVVLAKKAALLKQRTWLVDKNLRTGIVKCTKHF